jgi:hypothetical protein
MVARSGPGSPDPGPRRPRKETTVTATHANATQAVKGTVEATNPKGIKVGGRWLNWSQ